MINERKRLSEELEKSGLEVYPSNTNFLLVRSEKHNMAEKLRERGVSVLDLSGQWLSRFFRISVGTRKKNDKLVEEIKKIENHSTNTREEMTPY